MLTEMAWAEPQYSRAEVDAAGATLIDDAAPRDAYENALTVINNWRSSHAFPLNTFQVYLRNRARAIDPKSLIAQRVKRLSSIDQKLRRFEWLRLSEMQDIGGCRAVVSSVRRVNQVVKAYKQSSLKHKLVDEDDYIRHPKRSGYRGYHLMYRYHSGKKTTYNDLKIEIQLRSPLQHAWATAVETVGTFIQQALKSSLGEQDWLRFFALMGTEIALRERTTAVPDTPTNAADLRKELREFAAMLDVEGRLRAYGAALRAVTQPGLSGAKYYLLSLDLSAHRITVMRYRAVDLETATRDYLNIEREIRGKAGADAVLVSVESLTALRRAYPNYFLDTSVFLNEVGRAIS